MKHVINNFFITIVATFVLLLGACGADSTEAETEVLPPTIEELSLSDNSIVYGEVPQGILRISDAGKELKEVQITVLIDGAEVFSKSIQRIMTTEFSYSFSELGVIFPFEAHVSDKVGIINVSAVNVAQQVTTQTLNFELKRPVFDKLYVCIGGDEYILTSTDGKLYKANLNTPLVNGAKGFVYSQSGKKGLKWGYDIDKKIASLTSQTAITFFDSESLSSNDLTYLSFDVVKFIPAPLEKKFGLITSDASVKTQNLYRRLKQISETNILFGHEDANHYGHNWIDKEGKSDVKDVCGSHPAVYGHDFGDITGVNQTDNQRKNAEDKLRSYIMEAYYRGGVSTMVWHFNNPANGKSFYFKDNPVDAVPMILPGGRYHDVYKKVLTNLANFAASLKDNTGELVPVIFRPYHEYDGDWFWWGKGHCSEEEFIRLWQFTVDYLRNTMGVKNFIYAISPDCSYSDETGYLTYYPGDEYVDILGMDNYWDFSPDGGGVQVVATKLKNISDMAQKRKKVAAFTETGREGIPEPEWWTKTLLPLLKDSQIKLCYVMVWRNAYNDPKHYYAPFPGEGSCEDFIKFRNDGFVLFEDDLTGMYN